MLAEKVITVGITFLIFGVLYISAQAFMNLNDGRVQAVVNQLVK